MFAIYWARLWINEWIAVTQRSWNGCFGKCKAQVFWLAKELHGICTIPCVCIDAFPRHCRRLIDASISIRCIYHKSCHITYNFSAHWSYYMWHFISFLIIYEPNTFACDWEYLQIRFQGVFELYMLQVTVITEHHRMISWRSQPGIESGLSRILRAEAVCQTITPYI
jgi:hypothetical protein